SRCSCWRRMSRWTFPPCSPSNGGVMDAGWITRTPTWTLSALVLVALPACGDKDDAQNTGGADGIDSGFTTFGNETGEAEGNDDNNDTGPKFDLEDNDATIPGGGACPDGMGGGGMPGDSFSYIWVSNSPNGTVSKINTDT